MAETTEILCDDLDAAINDFANRGYRLDMIFPADSPRGAAMSVAPAVAAGLTVDSVSLENERIVLKLSQPKLQPPAAADGSEWITGRAGMEYRDLIDGRMGGKVIASQIRLTQDGEVPDYVHYHNADFQVIFCTQGRIEVVYEDQGPPFWLETGDCVLQPPGIRHRVLQCTAGAEVIEVSSPAEHETWVDHDIELPTAEIDANRIFGGQKFLRSIASDAVWEDAGDGTEIRSTGIFTASSGKVDIRIVRKADRGRESITAATFSIEQGLMLQLDDGSTLIIEYWLS